MQSKDLVLGIDTSNYTTSLAVTDIDGSIIIDARKLLTVRQGERGLRQSHALFQHMGNLPEMILAAFEQIRKSRIRAVAASGRPRPVEGSYMPVFKAGVNYGKVMAASLGVPFFECSHQEGHLEAIIRHSKLSEEAEYLAYHLSGGTSELLHIKPSYGREKTQADMQTNIPAQEIQIIGGSRDLSFGQVLDRVGVSLGIEFPAGKAMDQIALKKKEELINQKSTGVNVNVHSEKNVKSTNLLKKIPIDGLEINLSGIETQCSRLLEQGAEPDNLVYELFLKISSCLCSLTEKAVSETDCRSVLFTGGVSASLFVREELTGYFGISGMHCDDSDRRFVISNKYAGGKPVTLEFGDPNLSSDNAVGVSFLGGKALWRSNQ